MPTFTPNGKREFVPRDQIFPLIAVYCFLFVLKNKWFNASFIRKEMFVDSYYLLSFLTS